MEFGTYIACLIVVRSALFTQQLANGPKQLDANKSNWKCGGNENNCVVCSVSAVLWSSSSGEKAAEAFCWTAPSAQYWLIHSEVQGRIRPTYLYSSNNM